MEIKNNSTPLSLSENMVNVFLFFQLKIMTLENNQKYAK